MLSQAATKRLLLIPVLLVLGSGCAAAQQQGSVFTRKVVLFVSPDAQEVALLKQQMGEQDFYIAADDENWYRSLAFDLLESLGVESRVVEEKRFRFLVRGTLREYDWSGQARSWFVVLYDGEREPRVTYSVDLPAEVEFLTE